MSTEAPPLAANHLTPGLWKLDTNHTQVGFSIRHLGISTVHGFFADFSGHARIGADAAGSAVELIVRTASINTGNTWRDEHLVKADFLDCERFPEMTFRSTSLTDTGAGYVMAGDLTVKGVTRPIRFDVTFHGTNVFPVDKKTHAGFVATTNILRSDFDCGYGVPIASDEVGLRIDAQLIEPEPD